jgi:hypothetical protein
VRSTRSHPHVARSPLSLTTTPRPSGRSGWAVACERRGDGQCSGCYACTCEVYNAVNACAWWIFSSWPLEQQRLRDLGATPVELHEILLVWLWTDEHGAGPGGPGGPQREGSYVRCQVMKVNGGSNVGTYRVEVPPIPDRRKWEDPAQDVLKHVPLRRLKRIVPTQMPAAWVLGMASLLGFRLGGSAEVRGAQRAPSSRGTPSESRGTASERRRPPSQPPHRAALLPHPAGHLPTSLTSQPPSRPTRSQRAGGSCAPS